MSENILLNIPRPVLFLILENLELGDINRLCKTSKAIAKVCRNKDFWYYKSKRDYPETQNFSWIDAYLARLKKELTEDTAQKEYLRRYGNDIDFRSIYYEDIKDKWGYISMHLRYFEYYDEDINIKDAMKAAESAIKAFIDDPNMLNLISTPAYNEQYWTLVSKMFSYVLKHYDKYPLSIPKQVIKNIYDDRFV